MPMAAVGRMRSGRFFAMITSMNCMVIPGSTSTSTVQATALSSERALCRGKRKVWRRIRTRVDIPQYWSGRRGLEREKNSFLPVGVDSRWLEGDVVESVSVCVGTVSSIVHRIGQVRVQRNLGGGAGGYLRCEGLGGAGVAVVDCGGSDGLPGVYETWLVAAGVEIVSSHA